MSMRKPTKGSLKQSTLQRRKNRMQKHCKHHPNDRQTESRANQLTRDYKLD
jgi:hypothetical protein